jgi:hypothetical protein
MTLAMSNATIASLLDKVRAMEREALANPKPIPLGQQLRDRLAKLDRAQQDLRNAARRGDRQALAIIAREVTRQHDTLGDLFGCVDREIAALQTQIDQLKGSH